MFRSLKKLWQRQEVVMEDPVDDVTMSEDRAKAIIISYSAGGNCTVEELRGACDVTKDRIEDLHHTRNHILRDELGLSGKRRSA